jgi:flagellar protein FliT
MRNKLNIHQIPPKPRLEHYKDLEDYSRQMLDAACAADWQQVAALGGSCGALLTQLDQNPSSGALSTDEKTEKARILQRILRIDAQIRYLAEPSLLRYERIQTMVNGR